MTTKLVVLMVLLFRVLFQLSFPLFTAATDFTGDYASKPSTSASEGSGSDPSDSFNEPGRADKLTVKSLNTVAFGPLDIPKTASFLGNLSTLGLVARGKLSEEAYMARFAKFVEKSQ